MDFITDILGNPFNLITSLLVVIGGAYLIVTENRKIAESGLSTGDYINDVLLEGHIKWIIYILVFVSIGQALLAASIHPVDAVNAIRTLPDGTVPLEPPKHPPINIIARFMVHLVTNLAGTLMNVMLSHKVVDLITSFEFLFNKKKSEDPRYYLLLVLKFVTVLWVGLAAFYVPYVNYQTIAQGLGELQMAKWALIDLFSPITGIDLSLVYQSFGYPASLVPMAMLSYLMFAEFGTTISHYILAIYDGFHAITSKLERQLEGHTPIKGINDDIKKFAANPTEGIKYLISKAGNARDRQDANTIVSTIVANFSTLTPQKRSRIAVNLARLVQRWRSLDANASQTVKRALESDTQLFFRKSANSGGLDRALSGRRP